MILKLEYLLGSIVCVKTLEPLKIIPSKDVGCYPYQTKLGWCIVGPIWNVAVKDVSTGKLSRYHFLIQNAGKDEYRTDVWTDLLQWLQSERSSDWEDRWESWAAIKEWQAIKDWQEICRSFGCRHKEG